MFQRHRGLGIVATGCEHLIEYHVVVDDEALVCEALGEVPSVVTELLDQLRDKWVEEESKVLTDLVPLVRSAAARLSQGQPVPELDLPVGECHVIIEKRRMENVLVHLIENAQQATATEGFIRVGLQRDEQFCVVEIQDSGHGMDAEFIKYRLFKPFDTTKGNAGMGIGMYESREFVRSLGGDIHVRSRPGEGTQVSVQIPATAPAGT